MFIKHPVSVLLCLYALFLMHDAQGQEASEKDSDQQKSINLEDNPIYQKILELNKMGDYFKERDLDDALHFYEQSVELSSTELRKPGFNKNEELFGETYVISIRKIAVLYHHWGNYQEAYDKYAFLTDWMKKNDDDSLIDGMYLHQAHLKYMMSDYHSSLDYYKQAEHYSRQLNDTELNARANQGIGSMYYLLGDLSSSMDYLQRSYKLADSLNYENLRINSLFTMGNINLDLGNFEEAEKNYLDCIDFYMKNDELINLSNAYLSLGSLYYAMEDYERAEKEYIHSMETASKLGDNNMVASALGNLGMVAQEMGDPEKAESYYLKALEIAREKKDRQSEMYILRNIARLRFSAGEHEKAMEYAFQSLDISHDIDHLEGQIWNYKLLADIHEGTGNMSRALIFYKNFKVLNDSLMDQERLAAVSEMRVAFDTENKEKQIEIQELQIDQKQTEIHRKNLILRFFSVIFALVIVLGLIFFYFSRVKRKNRRELFRQEGVINDLQYKISGQAKQIELQNTKVQELEKTLSALEQNLESGMVLLNNMQKYLESTRDDFSSLFKNNGFWFEWKENTDNNTLIYTKSKDDDIYLCLVQHGCTGITGQIINAMVLQQLKTYFGMDHFPPSENILSEIRSSLLKPNQHQDLPNPEKWNAMILKIERGSDKIAFTTNCVALNLAISRPSKTAFDQNQKTEYHELQTINLDQHRDQNTRDNAVQFETTELTLKSKDRLFMILACDINENQNQQNCLLHKEIVRLIDENQIVNFARQKSLLEEGLKEFDAHQHAINNPVMVIGIQI